MKIPKEIFFNDNESCGECPFLEVIEGREHVGPSGELTVLSVPICQAGYKINANTGRRPAKCIEELGL